LILIHSFDLDHDLELMEYGVNDVDGDGVEL